MNAAAGAPIGALDGSGQPQGPVGPGSSLSPSGMANSGGPSGAGLYQGALGPAGGGAPLGHPTAGMMTHIPDT